ncbi:MAG TPA: SRPBCC family protein [Candidatus Acidoferrales bacterium]|nr:SRPBCC family protein [Candidatus Acidoferrales bacterium]
METCPTDVILAPAHHIWRLLADPRELGRWSGTKLVEGPARTVSAGDRLVFRAAMFHITFHVLDMQAPRQFTLDIALPFGLKNFEQIQITPIDANSCRVTFN